MIGFDASELETIKGPIDFRFASQERFNPKDLPWPPRNVMVRSLHERHEACFLLS